jgi:hypothetical protein
MVLEACGGCRRHVALDATECPFCGASRVPATPRPCAVGRLSRAAVFAGATLAGCYTSEPAPQYSGAPVQPVQPQSPPSEPQPPPTPPPDDSHFAKPPAATGSGSIRGTVYDASTKAPLQGVLVTAIPPNGGKPTQQVRTDARGQYSMTGLPAGQYVVSFMVATTPDTRARAPGSVIKVGDGTTERLDVGVTYVPVDNYEAMPYGAPPRRRRLV